MSAVNVPQQAVTIFETVTDGGDRTVAGAKFKVLDRMGYVCTSGGGMVQFLSGPELPVVTALRRAAQRHSENRA